MSCTLQRWCLGWWICVQEIARKSQENHRGESKHQACHSLASLIPCTLGSWMRLSSLGWISERNLTKLCVLSTPSAMIWNNPPTKSWQIWINVPWKHSNDGAVSKIAMLIARGRFINGKSPVKLDDLPSENKGPWTKLDRSSTKGLCLCFVEDLIAIWLCLKMGFPTILGWSHYSLWKSPCGYH